MMQQEASSVQWSSKDRRQEWRVCFLGDSCNDERLIDYCFSHTNANGLTQYALAPMKYLGGTGQQT